MAKNANMRVFYYINFMHIIGHILFGHGPLLDIPYYVEHEPGTAVDYGLLDSSHYWIFNT